jgi:hypothetical protein
MGQEAFRRNQSRAIATRKFGLCCELGKTEVRRQMSVVDEHVGLDSETQEALRGTVDAHVAAKYLSRVCSLVRRTNEDEFKSEKAKYEHADNDIEKARESSWLLQGRAPKRGDSRLDCSRRNPGAAAEVSAVSCRLSDDGNRNQYFCCGGREPASVPRCLLR